MFTTRRPQDVTVLRACRSTVGLQRDYTDSSVALLPAAAAHWCSTEV